MSKGVKNLQMSVLIDIYGELLTDKQRDVLELYYDEDLSLAEIAEHEGISRQGVRDSIKRGEETLLDLESKLSIVKKNEAVESILSKIRSKLVALSDDCNSYNMTRALAPRADELVALIDEFTEED